MKKATHRILPLLLALTLLPAAACAVNITLTPSDAGGINSAISAVAVAGDTNNTITLNAGTYDKATDRDVGANQISFNNKNVTIIGNGAPGAVIIDAQNARRIFYIYGNSNVTFDNLTMKNGVNATGLVVATPTLYGGALDIMGGGAITITGCAFSGNATTGSGGGAVYIGRASTVAITNSTFSGNTATGNGGALYNDDGTVNITDSAFSNNTATGNGGAIYNNTGTVNIKGGTTITGGIYNNTGGTLTVNYGSTVDAIENHGTAKFEVLFGVTGLGGSLTATAGNSPVADGDFVESGSQMTFSAVPDSGYRVKQWTVKQWTDGNTPATSAGGNYSISGLFSPYKVTVEFEKKSPSPLPKTGDGFPLGGLAALLGAGFIAMAIMGMRLRKQRKGE